MKKMQQSRSDILLDKEIFRSEQKVKPELVFWFDAPPLRLVYIGRFVRSTKGIDVLIDAMEGIIGDNWRLDLVGGYGEFKDSTIVWAEKHPNVNFLGTWPPDKISKCIAQYDVCVVPSRYDGWNVVTDEVINAGVDVIITDAAASDELIEASGAGIVVAADDVNALRKAIQFIIDNPEVADPWKEKAKEYLPKISSESVGNYLIEVLEYTFLNETRLRPVCSWL